MTLKYKAFVVWFGLPYLLFLLVVPLLMWLHGKPVDLSSELNWKRQALIISICAVPAALGTAILWLLPIRRAAVGILSGAVIAILGILIWAWVQVRFFGGFERNAGTYVLAMLLLVPECLGGGFAGFLRSRGQ